MKITMIEAILFDLDDTLLGNDMDTFLPHYFALLGKYAERFLTGERFIQELLAGTQAMIASRDQTVSNRDVFWQTFQGRTGFDPNELEPFFAQFYRDVFPQLAATTEKRPSAVTLVQACFDLGVKVVVATNPLFPAIAVAERLAWAGVPLTAFPYDLVTTYENMHTTKPHPAYYQEILDVIDCAPEAAVMVGDDWKNDIEPADSLGLHTFWINPDGDDPPDTVPLAGFGSLESLLELVQSGWLRELA